MRAQKNMRGTILIPIPSTSVKGSTNSNIVVACFMCTAMIYGIGVCLFVSEDKRIDLHNTLHRT